MSMSTVGFSVPRTSRNSLAATVSMVRVLPLPCVCQTRPAASPVRQPADDHFLDGPSLVLAKNFLR